MSGRIARAVVVAIVLAAGIVACDRVVDLTQVPPDGFIGVNDVPVFPDGTPIPDAATDSGGLPDSAPPD